MGQEGVTTMTEMLQPTAFVPATLTICKCSCDVGRSDLRDDDTNDGKAERVLKESELGRMVDLGLGRGIDATDPKPWVNKSSFQIRPVLVSNVIGTEEGGTLQGYEREVSSVVSHQLRIKASIEVPNAPVTIGMDAEQSRAASSTRRTAGKKVVNRSISFLSNFRDMPVFNEINDDECKWREKGVHVDTPKPLAGWRSTFVFQEPTSEESTDNGGTLQEQTPQKKEKIPLTFEEQLSKWLVKRMLQRQELLGTQPPKFVINESSKKKPSEILAHFVMISDEPEKQRILEDCYFFIRHFKITHYVSTIELGALEYRVFTETDFHSTIGARGSLAVEKHAALSVSGKRSFRKLHRASEVKTIGKISEDGKVGRGTHDEAVVGIKIQPVFTLVKLPFIQLVLQRAIVKYMEEEEDTSYGPFLVAYGSEESRFYWRATGNRILGTSDRQSASLFFIITREDATHPHQFQILYKGDDSGLTRRYGSNLSIADEFKLQNISGCLDTDMTVFGTNSGPLSVKYRVSYQSQLLLYGRFSSDSGPISPRIWAQGKDAFFIKCANGGFKRHGYIGMKSSAKRTTRRRRRRWGNEDHVSACFAHRRTHNDFNRFLLFRLIPVSEKSKRSQLKKISKRSSPFPSPIPSPRLAHSAPTQRAYSPYQLVSAEDKSDTETPRSQTPDDSVPSSPRGGAISEQAFEPVSLQETSDQEDTELGHELQPTTSYTIAEVH